MLLANGNQPILTYIDKAGDLGGEKAEEGDNVTAYLVRTSNGFKLHYDVVRPVAKKVADYSEEQKLDTAAARAWAVEELNEGKPRYRDEMTYERHDGTTGTIPTKAQNMFGTSLVLAGDYNLGAGVTSFGGRFGVAKSFGSHTGRLCLKGELDAILRRTKFNDNAEQAGEPYTCYATEFKAMAGVAFGKHKDWRLYLGPMVGWEFYRTDSQMTTLDDGSKRGVKSWGNFIYYGANFSIVWDGYNSPVGFFADGGARLHKSVIQNSPIDKEWVATFTVGTYLKLFRNKTNNK
jgi:hypothetical protein